MIWFYLLAGAWAISGFAGTIYGAYCMDRYYSLTPRLGTDVYIMAILGMIMGPFVFTFVGGDIKRNWRGETFDKEFEKRYKYGTREFRRLIP